MENENLDKHLIGTSNELTGKQLVAVGVFLYLSIVSFVYLIDLILKDLLINFQLEYSLSFWSRELVGILVVVILMTIFLKKSKGSKIQESSTKIIWILIVALVLIHLLQFVYTLYQFEIWPKNFAEKLTDYYDGRSHNATLSLVQSILDYLKYIIIGVFLIRK